MPTKLTRETATEHKARVKQISAILRKTYAGLGCALHFKNPFELLVATILSAQCTDEKVNQVTPALFKAYPTPAKLSAAPPDDVRRLIQQTGFFNQKAKSIQGAAAAIVEKFGGQVPEAMDDLTTLPGVGRKTAHVVRGNAFDLPAVFVDTHFKRLTARLEISPETDPEKIEPAIMALLPAAEWTEFSHAMIWHGRKICIARAPQCPVCPLLALCPTGHQLTQTAPTPKRAKTAQNS
jgi:endonuclease-3